MEALGIHTPYFQQRFEACGRPGLSPIQKCTAAIRMLAYGMSGDACDVYVRIRKSTTIECLKKFSECVVSGFGEQYLRKPTEQDLQRLLHVGETRGFPGTCNDINVLDRSPLFNDIYNGVAPSVSFTVNGNQYNLGYYLTDGIQPPWATFIRSIRLLQSDKYKLFAQHQESAIKDVKRAFGVLQTRFAIIRGPTLMWEVSTLGKIMKACIILHNMIVEDERDTYTRLPNALDYEQTNITDGSLA